MYEETIGVILLSVILLRHSRNDGGKKKKDSIKKWTRVSLEENVRVTEDRMHGVKEVVQLERLTSELTTPTNVK